VFGEIPDSLYQITSFSAVMPYGSASAPAGDPFNLSTRG